VSKKAKKHGSRTYRIIYAIFAGIVGFILGIKVVGAQNEPDDGGFLVCSNHTSATDPIVICYAFRKNQIRFMAKKELFKIPLLATLIRVLGAFPVDRGAGDVGAIRHAVDILKSGESSGIFPQGHRYPGEDPRSTPTKNGAALICTRAEADVLPVYIWRKKNRLRLFSKTYVIIGEKIPYESLGFDHEAGGEYNRITAIIFDKICTMGEEFSESLKKDGRK
jgi:1-acyl-sn-glycerol-3-phosphate acyltransferase